MQGPYDDRHMMSTCNGVASGLTPLTNLQSLQLHNMESLTNLEALTHMPGLTSLALVGCCKDLGCAPPLLSALTSLHALEISCQTLGGDGGLDVLAPLTRLTRLVLANIDGLERLPASLTGLTSLQVGRRAWCAVYVRLLASYRRLFKKEKIGLFPTLLE